MFIPCKSLMTLLQCFLAHSEQWKVVSFQLLSNEVGFLSAAKGRLLLLKELDIIMIKDMDVRRTGSTIQSMVSDVFEDAPLLTRIVLCDDSALRFKFNRSSLTSVGLRSLKHYKNVLAALRGAVNLVELVISNTYAADLHIKGGELIYLPRLECLYTDEMPLLTVLETPHLQHLVIQVWRGDGSESSHSASLDDAGIIVAFLRKLGIQLNTLVIYDGHAAPVEKILLSMPEVDTLVLSVTRGIADVFKQLAGTQELPFSNLFVTWPFAWDGKDEDGESVGALYDMIAHRNPLGDEKHPSPKELIIRTPDGGPSVAADLKSLCRDRGIRFGRDGVVRADNALVLQVITTLSA